MITKMMITNTPIMTPMIPRFITGPPFVLLEVPASSSRKHDGAQPKHLRGLTRLSRFPTQKRLTGVNTAEQDGASDKRQQHHAPWMASNPYATQHE
jgi:hypothetical protein